MSDSTDDVQGFDSGPVNAEAEPFADGVREGRRQAFEEVFNALTFFWSDPSNLCARLRQHCGEASGKIPPLS